MAPRHKLVVVAVQFYLQHQPKEVYAHAHSHTHSNMAIRGLT